jgi:hypothetical protein
MLCSRGQGANETRDFISPFWRCGVVPDRPRARHRRGEDLRTFGKDPSFQGRVVHEDLLQPELRYRRSLL